MAHLLFVIDTSLSIENYIDNYLSSINNIIKNLDRDSVVSIATFSETYKFLSICSELDNVPTLSRNNVNAYGLTALYDNLNRVLSFLHRFDNKTQRKRHICVIFTDGDDNYSKSINPKLLSLQINIAKNAGWEFIFLGVNDLSLKKGREIGCNITILYEPTENCLSNISKVVSEFIKSDKLSEDIEVDLVSLTRDMGELKV